MHIPEKHRELAHAEIDGALIQAKVPDEWIPKTWAEWLDDDEYRIDPTGAAKMSKKATDRMSDNLRKWGYWNRWVTEAGKFGNSSLSNIMQMMQTGIMSHGTGFMDRSSATMMEPERYYGLQACIDSLPAQDQAVIVAAYRLDVSGYPEAMHEMLRKNSVKDHEALRGKPFEPQRKRVVEDVVIIDSRLHGDSLDVVNQYAAGSA
ncbi:MAG: hypothetical protein PF483_10010 [Halothiobacillus sp.]|jgi:hypothetical protein|nr:hypothetical protein [Halothiobacillus sp.]